jgi:hypothetical protein
MSEDDVGSSGVMPFAYGRAWCALVAALILALVAMSSLAMAQSSDPSPGSTIRVANTDGTDLNLRATPSTDAEIVASLSAGALLTVTGPIRPLGTTRWLPVRDTGGHSGWVDAQFTALLATPVPSPTATAQPAAAEVPPDEVLVTPLPTVVALPVEVEARVKFPETSGNDQEITVWVTRDGAPVPGATVTVLTDEGEAPFDRPVDPTDDTGRAHHAFDIRHDKGTVNLVVKARAPDGGEGSAETSYFRR